MFILDGHALVYRAFYAVRDLSNSKGQPTNAVFGFVNILKKILKIHNPKYITVCFDSKGPTLRQQRYAEYKIQRPPMPEDLRPQVPVIKDILKAWGIKVFELPGYEADDLIGTLSKKMSTHNIEVVVVSEDKDLYQLLNKKTKMFSVRKDQLLDQATISKKLGFEATHIVDFLALAGDKSDNIPGVAGVGEVTARNLINQFSTIENLYDNLDKVEKPKVREKLDNDRNNAILSKELALINCDVSIDCDVKNMKRDEMDRSALFSLFKDLEFKRLTEEFNAPEKATTIAAHDVSSAEDIKDVLTKINKTKQVAVLFFEDDIQLALNEQETCKIQYRDFGALKSVFENEKILKIIWDIKHVFRKLVLLDSCIVNYYDCLLGAYLVDPAGLNTDITEAIWKHLKMSLEKSDYSAQVTGLYTLYIFVEEKLREYELTELYTGLELPLSHVIYEMERLGVHLDLSFLETMSKDCEKKIDKIRADLYKQAGEEFNLNSPKQLSKILFEKLKLPVIKKTKTGYSTDEGVLTTLALNHDFPAKVLDYRHISKIKSTYIDALPKLVDENNYLHAEFLQVGTETGRLSSRNPNLQNMPIRTDLGRQIRKAIIPSDKKHIILAADYSQIELRVLAHLSNDENLIHAFKEGQDIHQFTASLMHDVDIDEVSKDMRYSAKRINFGIVYGMSAYGLSKDLGITPFEAQQFIKKYFERYPGIKAFMDKQIAFCEEHGYVETMLKRRRYINEINSSNHNIKQFAERQAINTPVQGTAADIIKLSMIAIDKELTAAKLKSKMIMTVHDELVFDVYTDEEPKMIKLVKKTMEGALKLCVPLDVSVQTGPNWLEMKGV